MDILEKAENALKYNLCDHCFGRQFAKLGHGFDNSERGNSLRTALIMQNPDKQEEYNFNENCWLCENLFEEIDNFVKLTELEMKGIEFDNFLIGSKIDYEIQEREEVLWAEISSDFAETIKSEINREIGKKLEKKIAKDVEFIRPEVLAIIDTRFDVVNLNIGSIFIYGRYKKLIRGIPQTKWNCKICYGRGCEKCNNTGKLYETSVEEIIAKEVMDISKGDEHLFHGMGREDIDVKMLGNGRPFVLEIRKPLKRKFDLKTLEKKINKYGKGKVEVKNLRLSNKNEVISIKNSKSSKSYLVKIELENTVNKQKVNEVVIAFKGNIITQRTPTRVVHRRADKYRERTINDIEIIKLDKKNIELKISAESGTYIKELIHGDDGRTKPSFSELLEQKCVVKELDVIEINEG